MNPVRGWGPAWQGATRSRRVVRSRWSRSAKAASRAARWRRRWTAHAILDLYEELKTRVVEWTHSQYAIHALDWIFDRPIFKSIDLVADGAIPDPTARRLLSQFRGAGLVKVLVEGRGCRAAVLSFPRLLNIAEGREVF